jgi:hypothetical protein
MAETEEAVVPANPDYVSIERHVLQDNINLIDAKSGILMALSGGFIVRCLDKFFELATARASISPLASNASLWLYAIASLGFLMTAFFTWFVVKPRVVKTNDLVYWGSDVFTRGERHFVDTVESTKPHEFRIHFVRHLYVLAGICRRKFLFFGRAMRSAELSLLTALAAELARYASYAPMPAWVQLLAMAAMERMSSLPALLPHW